MLKQPASTDDEWCDPHLAAAGSRPAEVVHHVAREEQVAIAARTAHPDDLGPDAQARHDVHTPAAADHQVTDG